jgi:putative flippase GtrA
LLAKNVRSRSSPPDPGRQQAGQIVPATSSSGVRYAIAAVAALCVDFALTLTLHAFTPLPLYACAAISFVTIGIGFYFIHEFWTFRAEGSRASAARLSRNLLVLGCAFLARISTIATLEFVHPPEGILAMVYFGVGAGLSFTINYLVNRAWVFSDRSRDGH